MTPNLVITHLFGYFMEIEGLVMNKMHERALRMVYNDAALLTMSFYLKITLTIHQQNLQKLAADTFKFKHNLAPAILNDIFQTTLVD